MTHVADGCAWVAAGPGKEGFEGLRDDEEGVREVEAGPGTDDCAWEDVGLGSDFDVGVWLLAPLSVKAGLGRGQGGPRW